MKRLSKIATGVVFLAALLDSTGALAADKNVLEEIEVLKRRLSELESEQKESDEKTETLAEEVERSKLSKVLPERKELKSEFGLGPAASGVYQLKQGLSLGGYGEATYRNFVSDANGKKDQADMLRLVGYAGYKFNDWLVFNSEVEVEHGTTSGIGDSSGDKEGEVSVEFAYLDFLLDEAFNLRTGMVLIPMGFLNEIHEPPFFHGVRRAELEQSIIPSTWREMGAGAFGTIGSELDYRTYVVNGLRASRFSDSGVRDGRQKGNQALAEDFAWTGRLDYRPAALAGFMVGGSAWLGHSGQDEEFAGETPDVFTSIWEAHAQYRYRQLELRGIFAQSDIDDVDVLSLEVDKAIAGKQRGWYVEAAYDVLPHIVEGTTQYLAPFVRFEDLGLQEDVAEGFAKNKSLDRQLVAVGLSYKPVTNAVIKLDYRNFSSEGDKDPADELALGVGYAF
ncbi:MAG: hypothetical protein IT291_07885 [Deltaproteobacteria bacterium]|nr:hypothetical protein [Deltaproteobacteria bacterium]